MRVLRVSLLVGLVLGFNFASAESAELTLVAGDSEINFVGSKPDGKQKRPPPFPLGDDLDHLFEERGSLARGWLTWIGRRLGA